MTQTERRQFLIQYLLDESNYDETIPADEAGQKYLLRGLLNVREPLPASDEFLRVQDEYLRQENESHGITDLADLTPVPSRGNGDFYLWRGDITTLKVGAIVNAANSGMTGCWQPCHACIDNCIHTFAGVQLRKVCADIMQKQGHPEPTGTVKITPAFNLPCQYVLHTVGPIISGALTQRDCDLLASCYTSCLDVQSVAFCCISTGVFRFPADSAAQIAVTTVEQWKARTHSGIKVIFNVFSQKDEALYQNVLGM